MNDHPPKDYINIPGWFSSYLRDFSVTVDIGENHIVRTIGGAPRVAHSEPPTHRWQADLCISMDMGVQDFNGMQSFLLAVNRNADALRFVQDGLVFYLRLESFRTEINMEMYYRYIILEGTVLCRPLTVEDDRIARMPKPEPVVMPKLIGNRKRGIDL